MSRDEKDRGVDEEILLPRGTVIKIDGIPFLLRDDTIVLGRIENFSVIRPEKLITQPVPSGAQGRI
jgi:hypothetical protein